MTELYQYRVVYPGGTFVRVSPSLESEKTGLVLPFGTVFLANKSLVLDGVNYVSLADGSGWVFRNKGDIEVLELVTVVWSKPPNSKPSSGENEEKASSSLNPSTLTPLSSITSSKSSRQQSTITSLAPSNHDSMNNLANIHRSGDRIDKDKLIRMSRQENKLWRELRAKCAQCYSFNDYLEMVTSLEVPSQLVMESSSSSSSTTTISQINNNNNLNNNNNNSMTIMQSQSKTFDNQSPRESQITTLISNIVIITARCASDLCDLKLLPHSLWVFVHMGSRVSQVMQWIVEHADVSIVSYDDQFRDELVHIAMEIGQRCKHQVMELAKISDVLADDIRNFLQRWIFVKAIPRQRIDGSELENIDIDSDQETKDSYHNHNNNHNSNHSNLSDKSLFSSTPIGPFLSNREWALSQLVCASSTNNNNSNNNNSNNNNNNNNNFRGFNSDNNSQIINDYNHNSNNYSNVRQRRPSSLSFDESYISQLSCRREHEAAADSGGVRASAASRNQDNNGNTNKKGILQGYWIEMKDCISRIASDPNNHKYAGML